MIDRSALNPKPPLNLKAPHFGTSANVRDLAWSLSKPLTSRWKQIAGWPQIGRRVTGLPVDVAARRVPVSRFPYHVVYMPWEGVFRILAFAHDSREPGYWLSRVRK